MHIWRQVFHLLSQPSPSTVAHLDALPDILVGDYLPLWLGFCGYPKAGAVRILLEDGAQPLNGGAPCLGNAFHCHKVYRGSLQQAQAFCERTEPSSSC